MFNLQCAFKSVFKHYIKLLKAKLPPRTFEEQQNANSVLLTEDQEQRLVYIVNTCEYCLEIVPQLHQQIEDRVSEEFENNIDLKDEAEDNFRKLIADAIRAIVRSMEARNDQLYATKHHKQNKGLWVDGKTEGLRPRAKMTTCHLD